MNNRWKLVFQAVILVLCFASCSPIVHKTISKRLPPLDETKNVVIYDVGVMPPKNAEVLGSVMVENGLGRCDWERILKKAQETARSVGGNGLEILEHAYPGDIDLCHIIVAHILNIDPNNKPAEPSEFAKQNFHDYVVLTEGDTTRCMITDENQQMLCFVYEGQGLVRRAQVEKQKILAYHIDDPVALADLQYQRTKKDFTVRFGFDGGYTFRTARIPSDASSDYKDYLRKLKRGPVAGADVRFNVDNMYTLGLHYSRFMSNNSAYFYAYDENENYYEGIVSDDHVINFYAFSFGGYGFNRKNEKHRLLIEYLIGLMTYYDYAEEFGYKYNVKGATLGMGVALDYDYMLSKHIGIGAGFSYCGGLLSKVYVNNAEEDLGQNKIGLGRINLTAGVRFYL